MNKRIVVQMAVALAFISFGCTTGIEGTKTITYSKEDKRLLRESEEEQLMKQLSLSFVKDWPKGKRFLVVDNRAAYLLQSSAMNSESLAGREFVYEGVVTRRTPSGSDEALLQFSNSGHLYNYPTGRTPSEAMKTLTGMDVPMLIDLDMIKSASQLLSGRKVWARTHLWYKLDGERYKGDKFVPVTIVEVRAGDAHFPMGIVVETERGERALFYMNMRNGGLESRTFQNLFALRDPREHYRQPSDEVWRLIQQGRVKQGMTKDECRLSLGNPAEVRAGHNWDSTLDLWQYANGTYLSFQDGLLVDFRE